MGGCQACIANVSISGSQPDCRQIVRVSLTCGSDGCCNCSRPRHKTASSEITGVQLARSKQRASPRSSNDRIESEFDGCKLVGEPLSAGSGSKLWQIKGYWCCWIKHSSLTPLKKVWTKVPAVVRKDSAAGVRGHQCRDVPAWEYLVSAFEVRDCISTAVE